MASTQINKGKLRLVDYELNYEGILSVFCILFGIADLTRPQLPKCNNHLVSFVKVDGLSVSYIVDIFDTIKINEKVFWGHTSVVLGPHGGFSGVFGLFWGAAKFFSGATRDARAVARLATRRARTLGSRPRLWLVLGLGFSVFPAAQRRDDAAARRHIKP